MNPKTTKAIIIKISVNIEVKFAKIPKQNLLVSVIIFLNKKEGLFFKKKL